ncbi:hypothetical protein EOL94_00250 [bacterium]|nr:hypothetical protein [bacterium]
MKNKVVIPGLLFLIAAIFSVFIITKNNKNIEDFVTQSDGDSETHGIILFYGDGCPHCLIVEEYLDSNNISKQITFVMKEVYNNQKNSQKLVEKAKICGMPTNSIGVPFLWDGAKCLVGDQDIIEFFKSKIKE